MQSERSCPSGGRKAVAGVLVLALAWTACSREERDFRANAGLSGAAAVSRTSELQPGPATDLPSAGVYQENRWAVSEGARLYQWFNCSGCHAPGGGGGIGPPLRDDDWIYGSAPEQVYASIVDGRPDGMPAFGERIDAADVWKLVAWVRSMSRLTPADTWNARSDNMAETNPRRRR